MRNRYNIYEALKSSFVFSQNSINDIQPGSIIGALLYSNAVELEKAFDQIDSFRESLYIDRATGQNLDFLIYGFSRLTRIPPKNSVGYVLIELGTALTLENLDLLDFSFSQYTENQNLRFDFPKTISFSVANKSNITVDYTLINPLNYEFSDGEFFLSTNAKDQSIMANYKEYLRVLLRKYKKPIKYLVLPIASKTPGIIGNIPSGYINISVNLGFPCIITNPFNLSGDSKLAYKYLKDLTTQTSTILADIDNILFSGDDDYGLGDFSYISGGLDEENDNQYRNRFYTYLKSLSNGTADSIKFAVESQFPGATIAIVEGKTAGALDVFIDSEGVLSRPTLKRIADVIDSVKPAGVAVSVKPTKSVYISILADVAISGNFIDTVNSLKPAMYTTVGSKALGESLAYDELINLFSYSGVSRADNVYYGELFSSSLFGLYKELFQKIYYQYGVRGPNTNQTKPWLSITYSHIYDQILNSESSIYLAYKNARLKYPLVTLVKRALDMDVVEKSTLSAENVAIVDKIKEICTGKRLSQCISLVMGDPSVGDDPEIINFSSLPNFQKISIANLRQIVGAEYAIYFKSKLLTVPFVKNIPSSESADLITRILTNDISLYTYDELIEASIGSLEKIKIARDFKFFSGVYTDSSLISVRATEK